MTPQQRHAALAASAKSYDLRVVRREDTDQVFRFLQDHYYPNEPINQSVRRIPASVNHCSHGETIKEGLSVMAIDRETGEVIGVSVHGVAAPDEYDRVVRVAKVVGAKGKHKVAKSFEIVAVIEREADIWSKLNITKSLRVLATAVHPDYQGLGLGSAFIRAAARMALDHRIESVSVVTSSHFFARACERLGGLLVHSVRYDRFVDEQGRPHLPVQSPHQAISMWAFRPECLLCVSGQTRSRPAAVI